jgi:hypothetical protein
MDVTSYEDGGAAQESPIVAATALHLNKNLMDTPNTAAAKEFKETIVTTVNTEKLASLMQHERKAASEDLSRRALAARSSAAAPSQDPSQQPKALSAPEHASPAPRGSSSSTAATPSFSSWAQDRAGGGGNRAPAMPLYSTQAPTSALAQSAAPIEDASDIIDGDSVNGDDATTVVEGEQDEYDARVTTPPLSSTTATAPPQVSLPREQIDSVLGTAPASPQFGNSKPRTPMSPSGAFGGSPSSGAPQRALPSSPSAQQQQQQPKPVVVEDLHTDDEEEEEVEPEAKPTSERFEDSMTDEEILNEKTDIMNDIKDYIALGVAPPTRPLFGMNLRMLRRIRQVMAHKHEETLGVGFLGVAFIEFMSGAERLNTRYDPVAKVLGTGLRLQGMGDTVERKIEKYRIPFQRIYRKHLRTLFNVGGGGGSNGSMSPWVQLGLVTMGIAGKVHKTNMRKEMARQARAAAADPSVRQNAARVLRTMNNSRGSRDESAPRAARMRQESVDEDGDEDTLTTEDEFEQAAAKQDLESIDAGEEEKDEDEEDDDDVPVRKPPMPTDQGEPMNVNTRKEMTGLSNVGYSGKIDMHKRMAQYEQLPPSKHAASSPPTAAAIAAARKSPARPSAAATPAPTAAAPRAPFAAMNKMMHPVPPFDPSNTPSDPAEADDISEKDAGDDDDASEEEDSIEEIY